MNRENSVRRPVFRWEPQPQYQARLAAEPSFLAEQLREAATQGDAAAQLALGHMLLNGYGVQRDAPAAFRWFQLAARSGHPDAMNMLGRCHELGWGTPAHARLAAQCYRAAGGRGHAWANFNLAMLMLADEGVQGSKSEIVALLARAARRGNAKALTFLGHACEDGWLGPPKIAAARRWFLRAASKGCFRGAFHAARHCMAQGDVQGALRWLEVSLEAAPASYCHELAGFLADHPDERLRAVAERARQRAQRAAEGANPPAPALAGGHSSLAAGSPGDASHDPERTPGQELPRKLGTRGLRRALRVWGRLR